MEKPAISVVIPCYNEALYLSRCLTSVRDQTFTDFETIVVDNNSTDTTRDVAKKFKLRLLTEKTQGSVFAREAGFRSAQADIIATTDADTVLPREWLSSIADLFEQNPSIVGISGSLAFIDGNRFQRSLATTLSSYVYYPVVSLLMGHPPFTGTNFAVRKAAWERITATLHIDNPHIFDDVDFSCHLASTGRIYYAPGVKTYNSLRRWKKRPLKTMKNYTVRLANTIWLHHPFFRRNFASRFAPLPSEA